MLMKFLCLFLLIFSTNIFAESNTLVFEMAQNIKKNGFFTVDDYTITSKIDSDKKIVTLIHKPTKNFSEVCKRKNTNNGFMPDDNKCFDNYNLMVIVGADYFKLNFFDFYGRSKFYYSNTNSSTMTLSDVNYYVAKINEIIIQK